MKIVVFDLDETLGYFTEYGIFLECLKKYLEITKNNYILNQNDFNITLDLFQEFLRPNILTILSYLKNKKQSGDCNKIIIYTNNKGSPEWINNIVRYFEYKIKYKLFDTIISAFKIKDKQIEFCRTTHNKCHEDLVRCSKIPQNAEICFIDDIYHLEMNNTNIYYIYIKPYYFNLNFKNMILQFMKSNLGKQLIEDNIEYFYNYMMLIVSKYKYNIIKKTKVDYNIDKILGKQLLLHLQNFFAKKINN